MKKSDLLTFLQAKFYHVADPSIAETFGTLWRYTVSAFDLTGDILRRVSVDFYVQDEGLPGEVAYWATRQPSAQADTSFRSDVDAYIAAKVADGTIVAGYVVAVDEANKRAIAYAYVVQASNLNEIKVLLRRVSGAITHTIINAVIRTGD